MDIEDVANPISFLPPLLRLSHQSAQDISHALKDLRKLYWPPLPSTLAIPKRTTARVINADSAPDSGYASAEEDLDMEDAFENAVHTNTTCHTFRNDDHLKSLRANTTERDFVLKWITGFIARSGAWIDLATNIDDHETRSYLLDDATAILAAFVGARDDVSENGSDSDDEDQATLRHFSFLTPSGDPLTVDLRDIPLLDDDHTSVGLQSWGSSICLGKRLCKTPVAFSLSPSTHSEHSFPLRILELGAGTGLLSIITAKLLSKITPTPTIIATDYHPDVLVNLTANIRANFPFDTTPPVSVHELDWEKPFYVPQLHTSFDVIFAADVIYHPDHARWIKGCVERLLKRPFPIDRNGGVFWMIIALRPVGRHEGLDKSVVTMFSVGPEADGRSTLVILETEDIARSENVGRADESGYRLFKIGWNA